MGKPDKTEQSRILVESNSTIFQNYIFVFSMVSAFFANTVEQLKSVSFWMWGQEIQPVASDHALHEAGQIIELRIVLFHFECCSHYRHRILDKTLYWQGAWPTIFLSYSFLLQVQQHNIAPVNEAMLAVPIEVQLLCSALAALISSPGMFLEQVSLRIENDSCSS